MALIEKITAIADAIREKNGSADKYRIDQMPAAISGLLPVPDQIEWVKCGLYTAPSNTASDVTITVGARADCWLIFEFSPGPEDTGKSKMRFAYGSDIGVRATRATYGTESDVFDAYERDSGISDNGFTLCLNGFVRMVKDASYFWIAIKMK